MSPRMTNLDLIISPTSTVLRLGAVAIGRNEGERLRRCLTSLIKEVDAVVFVDSGSTDQSVAIAKLLGVEVVELDMSQPFTMARGRNAGWRRLLELHPEINVIQFVDGDVEVFPGWLNFALHELENNKDILIASGRRRERHRNATPYNRLADMEWDTPHGVTNVVLGDMMVRVDAIRTVNGFNPLVIAAEDDEFCLRVSTQLGGQIVRLDKDMSLHDAAMTTFPQWWRRMVRAGYGFAQVGAIHPDHFVGARRKTWLWGLVLPLTILIAAPLTRGLSFLLLSLYALSFYRTLRNRARKGDSLSDACLYAYFVTISKFPSLIGMLTYYKRRLFNEANTIIEYK